MNQDKIQKLYIRSLYKSNECIDINTIHSNFKSTFNIPLKLSNIKYIKKSIQPQVLIKI